MGVGRSISIAVVSKMGSEDKRYFGRMNSLVACSPIKYVGSALGDWTVVPYCWLSHNPAGSPDETSESKLSKLG